RSGRSYSGSLHQPGLCTPAWTVETILKPWWNLHEVSAGWLGFLRTLPVHEWDAGTDQRRSNPSDLHHLEPREYHAWRVQRELGQLLQGSAGIQRKEVPVSRRVENWQCRSVLFRPAKSF